MKPKKLDFNTSDALPMERPKEPKNSLFDEVTAISRSLAKTQINWNVEEKKLFMAILTHIRWTESGNSTVIELNKRELVKALRLEIDSSDQSRYLREAFRKLARDSEVHWTDPEDKQLWRDDFLILSRWSSRGSIFVQINDRFMPHLENLIRNTPFLTFWSSDVYGFKSRFSFLLYEELRLHYDNQHLTNYRQYSTQELKRIFQLSKTDYMRSKEQGGFNRTGFERQVLNVAIDEINKTRTMQIIANGISKKGNMLFYKKIKKDGLIVAYEFRYIVKTKLVNSEERNEDESDS